MTNYEIADQFTLLSKIMDIHGENSFKTKSYSSAAYNIEQLTRQITEMSADELYQVRGIGQAIGEKIQALLQTGTFPLLQRMLDITPAGIVEMLDIKGLGPKKIGIVWKELGIESIGELEYACNENRLVAVKGFGEKTQQNILVQIAFIRASQGFHLFAEIEAAGKALVQQLQERLPGRLVSLTGAGRRQMETVSSIEILTDATVPDLEAVFKEVPEASVATTGDNSIVVKASGQPTVSISTTSRNHFYRQLFITTGSEDFLKGFFERYTLPDAPESEEAIFAVNGLSFIPPALREQPKILERAEGNTLPDLIQASDIRGIIHSHSTWSDGSNTLAEMAAAAIDQGLEYLVISDHSQAAFYAKGLSPERIIAQHQEIDALNKKLAPFKIFKSIEADILHDGQLDYTPDVLASLDLVIASVHSNLKMPLERAMGRLMRAIENPFTTILGHPTGRLLLSREGYPVDHKAIIDACAANNVVIEINAHPRRLDIDWRWIDYAIEKGVLLSIDPDAHSIAGYKDVYYGTLIGQKGGLTPQNNLSSYNLQQFEAFLEQYNEKRSAAIV